jgi:hypothetical protein
MRKIEAAMVLAVKAAIEGNGERYWRNGNTEVELKHCPDLGQVVVVSLHGNVIAEFDVSLAGVRECRGLRITDAGWQTTTTKSRLNALLQCFAEGSCLYQKKGQWFAPDATEWWGTFWLAYGWRDGWFCQQAEALCKPAVRASGSVYDVEHSRAIQKAVEGIQRSTDEILAPLLA